MAIQKEIEFENGVTANYHKISDIILPEIGAGLFNLKSFVNSGIRELGIDKFVIPEKNFSLTPEQVEELRGLILASIYGYLKELPEFEDAEDC